LKRFQGQTGQRLRLQTELWMASTCACYQCY